MLCVTCCPVLNVASAPCKTSEFQGSLFSLSEMDPSENIINMATADRWETHTNSTFAFISSKDGTMNER